MEGISDIQIVGMDENRPPRVRKEPYIDLFFKLSHKAPADWCEGFNNLMTDQKLTGNINKVEGVYIETWVRTMDDIPKHLGNLQRVVEETTKRYLANILQRQRDALGSASSLQDASGEQGRLNKVISSLNFGPKRG